MLFFDDFGGPGPIREPSWNLAVKKLENLKCSPPLFGRLFGEVMFKKQILDHLEGIDLLAYFWHRF